MEETFMQYLKQYGGLIELLAPIGGLFATMVKIYDDSYQTKLTLSFMNHAEKVRYMRIQRIMLMFAFALLFFIPGFVFNELQPAKNMLSGLIVNCEIWVMELIICAIPILLASLFCLIVWRKDSKLVEKRKKFDHLYVFFVLTIVFFLMEGNIIMSCVLSLGQYVLVDVLFSIVAGLLCLIIFSEMYKHLTRERAYLKYSKENKEFCLFGKLGDYIVAGDKEWIDECSVFNLIKSDEITEMKLTAINLGDRNNNTAVKELETQVKPVKAKKEKQKNKSRKRRIDMKTIITRICYVLNFLILVGVLLNVWVLIKIQWKVPVLCYIITIVLLLLEIMWFWRDNYIEWVKKICKSIGEVLCKLGAAIGKFLVELWTKKVIFIVALLLSIVLAELIYSLINNLIIRIIVFLVATIIAIIVFLRSKKNQKNKAADKKKEGENLK